MVQHMDEAACNMANLGRHLAIHLGDLLFELAVGCRGFSRNLDETQASPRLCSPIVRFCTQLRKPVENRKSKPVEKSGTYDLNLATCKTAVYSQLYLAISQIPGPRGGVGGQKSNLLNLASKYL